MVSAVGVCAYCGNGITGKTQVCGRCQAVHHSSCWMHLGCAACGCKQSTDDRSQVLRPGGIRALALAAAVVACAVAALLLVLLLRR